MTRIATSPVVIAAPVRGGMVTLLAAAAKRVALWSRVAAERRRLAALSDERLSDIGLDADGAWSEASRPFWDAPSRG